MNSTMDMLPACAHYLRRILRHSLKQSSPSPYDLLQDIQAAQPTLEGRLHTLYPHPQSYCKVILQIEQLVYSHQHLYARRQTQLSPSFKTHVIPAGAVPAHFPSDNGQHNCIWQQPLQAIARQLLWWLGYRVFEHSPNVHTHHSQVKKSPSSLSNIFIVDDTLEVIQLVSAVLSDHGYQVKSALNGAVAMTSIQQMRPDLILLDIKLPDMNGYQVYEQLQTSPITAHIPVIFLSGMDESSSVKSKFSHTVTAKSDHPTRYIQKPFKPEHLIQQIKAHLATSLATKPSDSHPHGAGIGHHEVDQELSDRRQKAQQLYPHIPVSEEPATESSTVNSAVPSQQYFFRATLEGRYLRVDPIFAQLCQYASAEAMMSQITNVWDQLYHSMAVQPQWG